MTICCIEDQPPTQEILEILIKEQLPDAEIHMFSNTASTIGFLSSNEVDLVISDLDIIGVKELRVIEHSKAHNIPCIVYSAHSEQGFVNAVFNAGATAFISKFESLDKIRVALKSWDSLSSTHGSHTPHVDTEVTSKVNLSERDIAILTLVIKGESREDIADKLCLSVNSVNTYLRNMCTRHNCKKEELIHRFLKWNSL